jgi:catechol 2,3-dioxygenase-like lactoylglutathione lyase family enzyme
MSSWKLSHIEHTGFTVPDLVDAVRFFVDHRGAEELYRSSRKPGAFLQTTFAAPEDASFQLSGCHWSPPLARRADGAPSVPH